MKFYNDDHQRFEFVSFDKSLTFADLEMYVLWAGIEWKHRLKWIRFTAFVNELSTENLCRNAVYMASVFCIGVDRKMGQSYSWGTF